MAERRTPATALIRRDFIRGLAALTGWGALAPTAAAVRAVTPHGRAAPVLECHVAGTSHSNVRAFEAELSQGDRLRLQREPDNPYDSLAVLVLDGHRRKLGYIPRTKNEMLARLLDYGSEFSVTLTGKTWRGGWLKLDIELFPA